MSMVRCVCPADMVRKSVEKDVDTYSFLFDQLGMN